MTVSVQEANERRFAALSRKLAETAEGQVTAVSWSSRAVTVDVGGVVQPMRWEGTAPSVGDRVRVKWAGGQPFCSAVHGAALGTVDVVGSNVVTVTGDDGGSYTYPHEFGASFSVGQRVAMDHDAEVVLFRLSTDPAAKVPVETATPPDRGTTSQTFYPTDSANWWATGGRWDAPFAEVSVSRSAFYFYGTQIADTIPNSATVVSASLQLREVWDRVPGVASLVGTHGAASRPGSAPALSGATAVDGSGSWDITGLATALKNGTAFGVGMAQNTGWRQFDSYARSGAITVTWQT